MSVMIEPDFVGNKYPLTHGRICGQSVLPSGTVVAASEKTGFEGVNVADPREHNFWRPGSANTTLTVTLPEVRKLSYIALAAHNLGSLGVTVRIEVSDGLGGFDNASGHIAPADDTPFIYLFKEIETDLFRLRFKQDIATIGVVYAGEAIEVPVRAYTSIGTPANIARKTEFDVNRTSSGAFVGRSVRRDRNVAPYPIEHVSEYWVQNTLDPFIEDAILNPYFLAENPHQYPDATQYKWAEKDIMPKRMGVKNLMSVTL